MTDRYIEPARRVLELIATRWVGSASTAAWYQTAEGRHCCDAVDKQAAAILRKAFPENGGDIWVDVYSTDPLAAVSHDTNE